MGLVSGATAATTANAPTREWFDKYLTASLVPTEYSKIFDPVKSTEFDQESVPQNEDGYTPSQVADMRPSYYNYGSDAVSEDPFKDQFDRLSLNEDIEPIPETQLFRRGGLASFAKGGQPNPIAALAAATGGVPHKGSHYVRGAGGGQDDLIDAKLADGEYVFDADIVAALGDGSNEEGAKRLDKMREIIRAHKRSAPNDKIPPKAKSPLAYFREAK